MTRLGIALLCAAVPLGPLQGQSNGNAPLILELPAGTRALGLGGAYVLSAATSGALFHHPGLIGTARGFGFDVQRYSAATMASVSSGTALGSGGLAAGLQFLSYGMFGIAVTDVPFDAGALLRPGPVAVSELVGTLGYGREIAGFRTGITAKIVEQRIGSDRDATAAVDIGVVRQFWGITWGLSGQNLGPGLETGTRGDGLPLPARVTLAASSRSHQLGPLDLIATAAVSRRRDGDIVPSGGIEISYWPIIGRTFTGRIGFRRVPGDGASPVTLGAAFTADNFTVEYAFEEFDGPGSAHRFGLRWR
jgi:hypothetical protein